MCQERIWNRHDTNLLPASCWSARQPAREFINFETLTLGTLRGKEWEGERVFGKHSKADNGVQKKQKEASCFRMLNIVFKSDSYRKEPATQRIRSGCKRYVNVRISINTRDPQSSRNGRPGVDKTLFWVVGNYLDVDWGLKIVQDFMKWYTGEQLPFQALYGQSWLQPC